MLKPSTLKLCVLGIVVLLQWLPNVLSAQSPEALAAFEQLATERSTFEWLKVKPEKRVNSETFIQQAKELYDLKAGNELTIRKSETDDLGWTHYRLQQKYKNIPVEFSEYILHEKAGVIQKANGRLIRDINVTTEPQISDGEALQILLDYNNIEKFAWEDEFMEKNLKEIKEDSLATYCPKGELVLLSPELETATESHRLAYKFDIFSIEPYDRNYFYVDAQTGEIIKQLTRIHENDVQGVASTNYYGTINLMTQSHNGSYRLRETGRGNGIETFTSNNTTSHPFIDLTDSNNQWYSPQHKTPCEAHWGTEKVYDYFLNEHNRNSFNNQGAKLQSWVNYRTNYVNAFWNGSYMTYGDGNGTSYGPLTCLDVVGHEITHAITERTAGLIYSYESGALNESFSDIFGTLIEFEADPSSADWYMGEDANLTGNGFINMSNPNAKNHPDTYMGTHWYTGSGDYGGVHYNSGVQNFWFYLLAQGGSGTNDNNDAYNVAGLGTTKAGKIAFRNLTVYLTPTSNYAAARNGSIQAATDLYGANSNEVLQVQNAWCAVGVGSCSSTPAGQLTLTSPNGGEVWNPGTTKTITWNSTGTVGPTVKLQYSTNGGTTWNTITNGTANDGSRSWSVPNVSTTVARVRVTSTSNNAITDMSNANFKIEAPAPPPNNCNATSLELGPDVYLPNGGSVTLSTGLNNMAYTVWDYQGSLIGTTSSLTVNNTGTYYVAVADNCGNTATDSVQVLAATQSSANVWPGDMNFDGVADFRDYDAFGLHFGETGPTRSNQDKNWSPHPATDWSGTQANSNNTKHVDADGDGLVDLDDLQAVEDNYGQTHSQSPIVAPPALIGDSPIEISLQPTTIPSANGNSNSLTFDLVLDNVSGNEVSFYGGYFTIDYYDPTNAASNPVVTFNNSWLGTVNEDLFYIAYVDAVNQQIQVGITRIDHANRIGLGAIGQIEFQVDNSVYANNASLDFEVSNIAFHNSEATDLSIASEGTTLNFGATNCPNDMVITANTNLLNIHQVGNQISTNGSVNISNGQNVIFKGNKITLNNEFSIQNNAAFSAIIDPCLTPNLLGINSVNNTQALTINPELNYANESITAYIQNNRRYYFIIGN